MRAPSFRTTASDPKRKLLEHIADRKWELASGDTCFCGLFSATFRYALISLLEIADAEDGINTTTIAQRHGIPGTYLANVLRDLRRLGLINSLKGRHGGYRLAKPAEEIDLLALHQGLAGSGDSSHAREADLRGAELWLQSLECRWRHDLANTTLLDVQRYVSTRPILT